MEKVIINATHRTVIGKKVGALRRKGMLPAIIYGHHIEPTPILMDRKEASHALHGITSSHVITINLEGVEYATLVRDKQRNFITGAITHVDFQAVSATEKIRTKVSIHLDGLAPAIKDFNGVVVTGLTELEVEALPQNLPERIIVDLTKLKRIGDGVYVRDLQLPADVEVLVHPEEMIAIVTETHEEKAEEVTPSAVGPEIIEHGKKEVEE